MVNDVPGYGIIGLALTFGFGGAVSWVVEPDDFDCETRSDLFQKLSYDLLMTSIGMSGD